MKKNLKTILLALLTLFMLGACKQESDSEENSLDKIVVHQNKEVYIVGEKFSKADIIVTAYYKDGFFENVTDYEISAFDTSKAVDKQEITISYKMKKEIFSIKVVSIVSLEIIEKPKNLLYRLGQKFSPEGLYVVANFNDGSKIPIAFDDFQVYGCKIEGFDSSKEDRKQLITIKYYGLEASFYITVTAAEFVGIQIASFPDKTTYLLNEDFVADGLEVEAVYSDGETYKITGYSITGFDSSAFCENKTVYVEYNGKTAEFSIKVGLFLENLRIESLPEKTEYFEGDSFDSAGLVINVYYSDGTVETTTDYTTNFDEVVAEAGNNKKVSVSFGGKTVEFTINVKKIEIDLISIISTPQKTQYYIGDELDITGMSVAAIYNNGTKTIVTDFTTNFDEVVKKAGKHQKCIVYYENKETFFYVDVLPIPEYIYISKEPEKKIFNLGEKINFDGLEVKLHYSNLEEEVIDTFSISDFDSETVGKKIIKISYIKDEITLTTSWEFSLTPLPYNFTESVVEAPALETDSMGISGKYVFFGDFPQSKVDSAVVTESDFYSDEFSVKINNIDYYIGKDGNYYTESNGNFYKLEPIKWRIVTDNYNTSGKTLLLAEKMLKGVPYYNGYASDIRDFGIHPGNYKYSTARAYLNGKYEANDTQKRKYENVGFLQTAFTEVAQKKIADTTVDNSSKSTADCDGIIKEAASYSCENTIDKIFLLSVKEATTASYGFEKYNSCDNSRLRYQTDYAISESRFRRDWWLRSPHYERGHVASLITNDGTITAMNAASSECGIVPALTISY